jgi:hypothetical protein
MPPSLQRPTLLLRKVGCVHNTLDHLLCELCGKQWLTIFSLVQGTSTLDHPLCELCGEQLLTIVSLVQSTILKLGLIGTKPMGLWLEEQS